MQVEKKIIPDAELIRLLRIDCASGIYPTSQGSYALLRAYDALLAERSAALKLLNESLSGRVYTDLDDALRQLVQAFISYRDIVKDEAAIDADYEAAVAANPEPGLTASQGQDSIGG